MKKNIFITDISHTLGREIAECFMRNGVEVIAGVSKGEGSYAPMGVHCYEWDLCSRECVQSAIQDAINQWGIFDGVVNTLDYRCFGPLEYSKEDHLEKMHQINVMAPLWIYQRFITHFKHRQQGNFLTVSQSAGMITHPFYAAYCASKWAMEGFCESLNYELIPFQVRSKLFSWELKDSGVSERKTHFSLGVSEASEYRDHYRSCYHHYFSGTRSYDEMPKVAQAIYRALMEGSGRIRYYYGDEIASVVEEKKQRTGQDFLDQMRKNIHF